MAPDWLPKDWPAHAASAWICQCGYLYRAKGPIVPRECVDCGPTLDQWKRCSRCQVWKHSTEFSVNSNRSGRLRAACRECRAVVELAKYHAKRCAA